GHVIGGPGGPPIRGPGPQGPPAGAAGGRRGRSERPPSGWPALAAGPNALYASGADTPPRLASALFKNWPRVWRLPGAVGLSVPLPSTSRSAQVSGCWLVDGAVDWVG